MLAATMAMFEFGVSLTAQQGQMAPAPSIYTYAGGEYALSSDQLWLKLLNNNAASDEIGRDQRSQSLCEKLMCRVSSTADCCVPTPEDPCETIECPECRSIYDNNFKKLSSYRPVNSSSHDGGFFQAACRLSKGVMIEGKSYEHRVFIVPPADTLQPYGFYSCLIDYAERQRCYFENDKVAG